MLQQNVLIAPQHRVEGVTMRIVIIDMSDYTVERDGLVTCAYGDEVLNSGWNTLLGLQ